MQKKYISILVIVVVVIAGFLLMRSSKPEKVEDNSGAPVSQNSTASTAPVLFASSPMAQYAYIISDPTLDSKSEEATMGFTIARKTLADGTLQITLNATNPEYTTQTYNLKAGEKLYFIEKFLGDDSENEDRNLKDDTAVIVDANGYIVQ